MNNRNYIGIDYSLGRSNIDKATGIHYGVISQDTVGEAWFVGVKGDYGKPHCPKCRAEVVLCADHRKEGYYCFACKEWQNSEEVYPEVPLGYTYERDGYKLAGCLNTDIFVLASPYYTHAQFCSPCAAGAGNLDHPVEGGPKTYCLRHEWFEGGEAPYPVYSVETGLLVNHEEATR